MCHVHSFIHNCQELRNCLVCCITIIMISSFSSFQGHQKFLEYFICHDCWKLQWMPQLLWCVHFHSWLPRASSTTQFVTSHSCLCPKLAKSFYNVFFVIGSPQSFPHSLYSIMIGFSNSLVDLHNYDVHDAWSSSPKNDYRFY